jgi:RNA polymerase sigma factor (sigma-70 family)
LGTDASSTTPGTTVEAGADEPPLRLRGDETELYGSFSRELVRKVSRSVRAAPEDIEDACAFAWMQFLRHQPDRDREWQGWLFRTAQRQAWVLNARAHEALRIVPKRDVGPGRVAEMADPRDRTEVRLDFEAALQELRKLPDRLQAVVLMRSQSSTHVQVAEALGVAPQRISQLLQAASAQLREISERRIESDRPVASPRAARLRELEDDPPEWLVGAIGRRPGRSKSSSGVVLASRRAALALDDYQRARGNGRDIPAIGGEGDADTRQCHERAQRAIEHLRAERGRRHGRDLGR